MADPISDAPAGSTGQVPSASPAAGPVTFGEVAAPDTAAYRRMRRLLRNAASPASPVTVEELGRLADVAAFFAACSGQVPPGEIGEAELVVFAAEHGVAGGEDHQLGLADDRLRRGRRLPRAARRRRVARHRRRRGRR